MSTGPLDVSARNGMPTLRLCALYPDLMNIYADRGNVLMLQRRCAWRGIGFTLSECGLGEQLDPKAHDLIYLGGGQDRDQLLCAKDMREVKGDALREAAVDGATILGVCGGYQLLGSSYELGPGEVIEGVGLLDVSTVRDRGPRLIGNVAIEVELGGGDGCGSGDDPMTGGAASHARRRLKGVLAGFENHGGRTRLGAGQRPLGKVLKGHGNDGDSGFEGAVSGSVIGTYLHGPLLPKNVWFADWLIATALRMEVSGLERLDDALEDAAHESALRAAGV